MVIYVDKSEITSTKLIKQSPWIGKATFLGKVTMIRFEELIILVLKLILYLKVQKSDS